jgi:hypothetical protein
MSRSASRCYHRRRGPNLCRPTLEPFDRSARAPATAPGRAARDHTVIAAVDRLYETFDTILVGRTTYDEMFAYWAGAETAEDTPDAGRWMARKMNTCRAAHSSRSRSSVSGSSTGFTSSYTRSCRRARGGSTPSASRASWTSSAPRRTRTAPSASTTSHAKLRAPEVAQTMCANLDGHWEQRTRHKHPVGREAEPISAQLDLGPADHVVVGEADPVGRNEPCDPCASAPRARSPRP